MVERLRDAIRDVNDFPKEGIVFKDITPILGNGALFRASIDLLCETAGGAKVDKVVGIDARGFIFAAAVADRLGAGFVPVRKKGKLECRFPSPNLAPNLIFVLRSLFGLTARAEIMAWLLTHETGHPAAIAKATGYFSKSIQTTLAEMEASRQIRSSRDGRERNYWLNRGDWDFLVKWKHPSGFPRWINWPPVFYFAVRTLELLEITSDPGASEQLRAIQQRAFLDEIMPRMGDLHFRCDMKANRQLRGGALTETLMEDVSMLGHLLESDFRIPEQS